MKKFIQKRKDTKPESLRKPQDLSNAFTELNTKSSQISKNEQFIRFPPLGYFHL